MQKKATFAFVFPGQGSQSVGMLSDLALSFSVVRETFAQASDLLGYDLWTLVQENPDNKINQTIYTQPAMLAADVAVWRCWLHCDGAYPAVVAGHSLGEYAALVCAESLSFADALSLVAKRGELMQSAVPEGTGAMGAVIGLDNAMVATLCDDASKLGVVSPANFNAIGQVVISGETKAVEAALSMAKTAGAKMAKRLPVSVPSHCVLMQPAMAPFHEALDAVSLATPGVPVIHNVDAREHTDAVAIKALLLDQLIKPVRWVETIERMALSSIEHVLECGPGRVLTGLNKRINKSMTYTPLQNVVAIEQEAGSCH
jgi:[acyl-carrier-protein] S-malonyltransferase